MKKNSYITLTDQFCGAGGSSIGAEKAGIVVQQALNHWKLATETYQTNHQNTAVDCTDVSACDPRRYKSTDFLITSPECTNHSLAKGKKRQLYKEDLFGNILLDPAEERSRATMWDVPRFAEQHDYRIIIGENVVDAAKWRLWDSWLHAMHSLGYEHEVVYFNSMFAWPTPQSRDRLYVVFWKKGNKKPDLDIRPPAFCSKCGQDVHAIQTWKKPLKWGRYKTQYIYRCPSCHLEVIPYYFAAFNAIDFSIEAVKIGEREQYGLPPLVPKSLARVKYGLERYGRQVMVITNRYTSGIDCRVRNANESPLPTQPGDSSHAMLAPYLVQTAYTHAPDNRSSSGMDAIPAQTTRQTVALVSGYLTKHYGGQADPRSMSLGLDDPAGTITTSDHHALIQGGPGLIDPAFISELHGTSKASGLDDPLMCVAAGGNHHALVSARSFLTYYYGNQSRGTSLADPINTFIGKDHAALVQALDSLQVEDLYYRMLQPSEIGRGMAFPDDYKVLGTKKERVRQYGQAVTPPAMELLINRCMDTFK